jgi:hypothetical protein
MSKFQPIFDRSKEALSIIGITSTHQSAQELRDFLKYEGCQHMLEGFGEYVASIEGICGKIEGYEAERQRKARISQHVGKRGPNHIHEDLPAEGRGNEREHVDSPRRR